MRRVYHDIMMEDPSEAFYKNIRAAKEALFNKPKVVYVLQLVVWRTNKYLPIPTDAVLQREDCWSGPWYDSAQDRRLAVSQQRLGVPAELGADRVLQVPHTEDVRDGSDEEDQGAIHRVKASQDDKYLMSNQSYFAMRMHTIRNEFFGVESAEPLGYDNTLWPFSVALAGLICALAAALVEFSLGSLSNRMGWEQQQQFPIKLI